MVVGASFASEASVPWGFLLGVLLGLVLLWQAGRLLNQLWWRPRRLERALRAQGIPGTVQEHGKMSMSWFGPNPRVTIVDSELSKDVLSNKFGHFEKLKVPALSKVFGDGLASHEGEKWVKHRRILTPAFHLEKLKLMLPAFSACCEELVSRWSESLGSDASLELDVWAELQNLTGDVISRTAFSSSYHVGRRIFQLQGEQAELVMTNKIESILKDIIGKRIQAMKQGESTKDDLLGLLLESNMRETEENGQSSMGMTIEDVVEECKVFYFAGMETTSWQDRAREEVRSLFGKNKPEYEGLSRLKIMTMILYEVLRLYPPAVSLIRKTYKEMDIGGIRYPAGVMLELPVLFIHHDPDIWGSDVHEFKPDRFSEGISKASKDPGAFLPFGWGPRICIGQNFALLERFAFELAPSYTHAPHTVITLHPMHGAQIKLRSV
ncbi:hypothetical protein HU200_036625 [Digitaria exilis]|uniref:Cytochrome P450 n=1 Tax=Digitaria exilis TaxID=1010633 RepID=A0A835BSF0_9POAL|nr:hypothetical protein HU200_036625 [Digitaria exilis]